MDIQIVGRNIEVSEEVRAHIEKKVSKLDRHLTRIHQGVVEISCETTKSPRDRYVAQITLSHSGTILRGEERASDVKTAINSAIDGLDRRIEHYKGTLNKRNRKQVNNKPEDQASEALQPRVVKEKRFRLERMSQDEAVDQMELLGHDFFLFISIPTERVSLLYRRQDGNYGLIEAATA